MRDHREAVGFGNVADLDRSRDAAAPQDVGLKNVDQPPARRRGKDRRQVPVFARRQRLPGEPPAHRLIADEVVRRDIVFDPLEPVRSQHLGQANRVLDVQARPGVQHQLDMVADPFARGGDQFLQLEQPIQALLRAIGGEQLGRLEAQLHVPLLVETGGIAKDALLLRAAQQLVDRTPQELAL